MWKRIIIVLGGAEIIVGGSYQLWPDIMPEWLSYLAIGVGVATILYAIFGMGKEKKQTPSIPIFLPMWKFQANWWLPYKRLIPMTRAVQIAYKKTQNNLASRVSEEGFGGKLRIESYYAIALANDGKTSIYGYKNGTKRFVKIPPETFSSGTFSDDANSFSYFGQKQPRFVGLAMTRRDLKKRLKEIKDWDGTR